MYPYANSPCHLSLSLSLSSLFLSSFSVLCRIVASWFTSTLHFNGFIHSLFVLFVVGHNKSEKTTGVWKPHQQLWATALPLNPVVSRTNHATFIQTIQLRSKTKQARAMIIVFSPTILTIILYCMQICWEGGALASASHGIAWFCIVKNGSFVLLHIAICMPLFSFLVPFSRSLFLLSLPQFIISFRSLGDVYAHRLVHVHVHVCVRASDDMKST